LERSDDGVSYRVVASLGTATSWQDVGLAPGATYSYRVRGASWTAETSNYTAPASLTMPTLATGAAVAPSALQAVANSATSVTVSWANNDPANPRFKVERAVYDPYHALTWVQVALTNPGATSFTDTGLQAESAYQYRVRATNAAGDSAYAVPDSDVMQSVF